MQSKACVLQFFRRFFFLTNFFFQQYDPTEPGDYRVEVRWAGELVPGSPFPVMIFDTQDELRRFMHGNLP